MNEWMNEWMSTCNVASGNTAKKEKKKERKTNNALQLYFWHAFPVQIFKDALINLHLLKKQNYIDKKYYFLRNW